MSKQSKTEVRKFDNEQEAVAYASLFIRRSATGEKIGCVFGVKGVETTYTTETVGGPKVYTVKIIRK